VSLALILSTGATFLKEAHAISYSEGAFPGVTQEGSSVNLLLSVYGATPGMPYGFIFHVRDPSSKIYNSTLQTTTPISSSFNMILTYPSSALQGRNDLCCTYISWVNQTQPVAFPQAVASTYFYIILTDKFSYQRTETVSIIASGYKPTELATVTVRTTTGIPQTVFTQTLIPTSSGLVVTSWTILKNATIDNYAVSVSGTLTSKNPSDIQGIFVGAATMSIASISSSSSSYQRTQTMKFSFQPKYPSGEIASTGAGLITLARPDRKNVTLTALYDGPTQTFVAQYTTSFDNQTGTWNATLSRNGYGDSYGNLGPDKAVSSLPQLSPATFAIAINANNYFSSGQTVTFNATIHYPDGSTLSAPTGRVFAFLSYSGGGYNDSMAVGYDSALQLWKGSYTPQVYESGGQWTLTVKAWDSPSPPNYGSGSKPVTLQDRPPVANFRSYNSPSPTGSLVTFNGTSSYDLDGTIASYSWNFGDSSTGSGAIVTHSFSTAGTYSVTLTVTDNAVLASSPTSSSVVITDRPPTVSFVASSNSTTTGRAVTISITASDPDGSVSAIKVDWGDGTIDNLSGVTTGDSHIYTLSGSSSKTFTVTLTVTDNSGSSASKIATVTVQPISGSPGGSVSFPLYYFGVLAAVIGALLVGLFLAFRRHKVTHARLKIDLEAVKAEAGRIENQEFFQSVKDQLKKDKE
jgi:PKD repeat protein